MKCPECGAQVSVEGNAARANCPYCGAQVESPAPAPVNPLAAIFEDKNGNGVPDFIEGMMKPGSGMNVKLTTSATVNQRYVVGGVEYGSLEEMPPEARKALQGAAGVLKGGFPLDFGVMDAQGPSSAASQTGSTFSKSVTVTARNAPTPTAQKKSKGAWTAFLVIALIAAGLFAAWLASRG
ncbi:MAG: hypothetical protein PHU25_12890 [Deltaproteobacteria bacterium]|nr:hypothetical protein [Deltaproteobacteria bacterium]